MDLIRLAWFCWLLPITFVLRTFSITAFCICFISLVTSMKINLHPLFNRQKRKLTQLVKQTNKKVYISCKGGERWQSILLCNLVPRPSLLSSKERKNTDPENEFGHFAQQKKWDSPRCKNLWTFSLFWTFRLLGTIALTSLFYLFYIDREFYTLLTQRMSQKNDSRKDNRFFKQENNDLNS